VHRLRTAITIILGAAVLLALSIALFWRSLLTPEQKLRYGLVFDAVQDFARRAAAHPDSAAFRADYVNALVQEGNLGRAAYLCDLYGVTNEQLTELRAAVRRSLQAAERGEVYDLGADAAVQASKGAPVREALRYLAGYRYALLGDWASAKNHLGAIDERKLAPILRPYWQYYLARSYRLAGDGKQKPKVGPLLLSVVKRHPGAELEARARYNLIALYLSEDYGRNGLALAKDQALSLSLKSSGWAKQKALTEFGQYYLRLGNLKDAWRMAQDALVAAPEKPAGEGAGLLCLDALEQALKGGDSGGLDSAGALALPLDAGTLTALGRAAARHGYAARTAKLLRQLKGHLTDRARLEELYAALAICLCAEDDVAGMQGLMAQANLRGFANPVLALIYFEYAQLLERKQQWTEALSYYRSSGKLGGPPAGQGGAGEALYRCYAILKRVQSPLDLDSAVGYLRAIVEQHSSDPAFGKAVEELIPLLIYRGQSQAARKLAEYALEVAEGKPGQGQASTGVAQAGLEDDGNLAALARYWLAYLGEKQNDRVAEEKTHAQAQVGRFSYYELALNPSPAIDLPALPAVPGMPETAAEYLAGLGLDGVLDDYSSDGVQEQNPAVQYLELANAEQVKSLSTRQWEATALLESGAIGERAVLDYVLGQAYPHPYESEVRAAAQRFGVPEALIYAVIKKESSFKDDAVSAAGAQGLMQLMPGTVQFLISARGLPRDSFSKRAQPAVNILLGAAYLRSLYDQLGLDPASADDNGVRAVLHCYNGGPANYRHWRTLYPNAGGALLTELIPNEENETFAKKVWKYYKIYGWLGQAEQ
jgi:soluble lytic murein transglycosylase